MQNKTSACVLYKRIFADLKPHVRSGDMFFTYFLQYSLEIVAILMFRFFNRQQACKINLYKRMVSEREWVGRSVFYRYNPKFAENIELVVNR